MFWMHDAGWCILKATLKIKCNIVLQNNTNNNGTLTRVNLVLPKASFTLKTWYITNTPLLEMFRIDSFVSILLHRI